MTNLKTIAAECATRIMDRMEMCRGSAILKGDIEREVEIALAQVAPPTRGMAIAAPRTDDLQLWYEDAAGVHIFSSYADLDAYIAQRDGPYPMISACDPSIIADLDNAVPYKPLISDDLWKSINEALKANDWRWAAERFGPGPAYVDLPECASGVIGATHKVKTPE